MGHRAGDGLTDQRILFCHNYIKYKFNGTQAAIKSGYTKRSASQTAAELLTIGKVKEYIEKLIREQLSEIDKMTLEWLQDVSKIQDADIRNIIQWGKAGKLKIKASKDLETDQAYAISEISEIINAKGERTLKVKLESKTKALELKGKYLSLLGDNNVPVKSQKDTETIEEKKERLAYLLKKNEVGDESRED